MSSEDGRIADAAGTATDFPGEDLATPVLRTVFFFLTAWTRRTGFRRVFIAAFFFPFAVVFRFALALDVPALDVLALGLALTLVLTPDFFFAFAAFALAFDMPDLDLAPLALPLAFPPDLDADFTAFFFPAFDFFRAVFAISLPS